MKEPLYQLDEKKLRSSSYMISVYDHDLKIRFWNRPTEEKFNIPAEKAIGKCLTELFDGYENDFRFQVMQDAVRLQKSYYFPDLPYQYRTGSYSQLIIPIKEGIAIISSDNDGKKTVPRTTLLNEAVTEAAIYG